jgi:prepilin-type N-terminal cleavage/methylation domain-containing protein
MRRGRLGKAFTLVELLVVIGIIALLISILLPALGKARGQANSLFCQSKLHSMGQLIQQYATENKGYGPIVESQVLYYTFADTLTLQSEAQKMYAPAPFPNYPAGSNAFMPVQDSGIFQDVDVPQASWSTHANSYMGNIRAMGAVNVYDPVTGNAMGYKQRQLSGITRSSDVMMIWCGSAEITDGINYGCYHNYPNGLDNYQMYGGHGLCYPAPALPNYTNPPFTANDYTNLIGLGVPLPVGSQVGSYLAGSVTPSYLRAANNDNTAGSGSYSGPYGFDTCNMRFRHENNTVCNFLFCDMHVESRVLGTVIAKNICLNP